MGRPIVYGKYKNSTATEYKMVKEIEKPARTQAMINI